MCLIVVAQRQHPAFPLILIANRDEFYQRPTRPAQYWDESHGMLAGQDLREGGSWLGINRRGQFAAVTNYREARTKPPQLRSRGRLVSDYLQGEQTAEEYLASLRLHKQEFRPFNLLLGEGTALYFLGSKEAQSRQLDAGIHGISNGEFASAWPKVERARRALQQQISRGDVPDEQGLFAILADTTVAADAALPDTGVGLELERKLAPVFIQTEGYGTRASSVLLITDKGEVRFSERNYDASGAHTNTSHHEFLINEQV